MIPSVKKAVVDGHVEQSLLCRVGGRLCALPIEYVAETMRPLSIEQTPGTPSFVRGLSIIRGAPVLVLDIGELIGAVVERPTRFVTVKTGNRLVALVVDCVVGVRPIPTSVLQDLPPLLRDAADEVVSTIGSLDAELLLVLHGARLVPDLLAECGDATP